MESSAPESTNPSPPAMSKEEMLRMKRRQRILNQGSQRMNLLMGVPSPAVASPQADDKKNQVEEIKTEPAPTEEQKEAEKEEEEKKKEDKNRKSIFFTAGEQHPVAPAAPSSTSDKSHESHHPVLPSQSAIPKKIEEDDEEEAAEEESPQQYRRRRSANNSNTDSQTDQLLSEMQARKSKSKRSKRSSSFGTLAKIQLVLIVLLAFYISLCTISLRDSPALFGDKFREWFQGQPLLLLILLESSFIIANLINSFAKNAKMVSSSSSSSSAPQVAAEPNQSSPLDFAFKILRIAAVAIRVGSFFFSIFKHVAIYLILQILFIQLIPSTFSTTLLSPFLKI